MKSVELLSICLKNVLAGIESSRMKSTFLQKAVELVAVSKTKPVEAILEAYEAGHRHFGENYVDELIEKAGKLPSDIKWHFIGHLQTNKCNNILKIPNLWVIESVDSIKLAEKLQKVCLKNKIEFLKIFVQLKTSSEETKFGSTEEESFQIVEFVINNCPNLIFSGVMTIGMEGDSQPFIDLRLFREKVCKKFNLDPQKIELSMGMSGDYEKAILEGSTNVRVGSLIFGQREYKK